MNETEKAIPMTEEEFLSKRGLRDVCSGYAVDKMRGNRELKTVRGQNRFFRELERAEATYQKKREAAKEEYRLFVNSGKLRDKTMLEKMLDRAHGHPDNASTQAARRMLTKRGYDWDTGAPLTDGRTKYGETV